MKQWQSKADEMARRLREKVESSISESDRDRYLKHYESAREAVTDGLKDIKALSARVSDSEKLQLLSDRYSEVSGETLAAAQKLAANMRSLSSSEEAAEGSEENKLKKSINALNGKDRVGLLGEGLGAAIGAAGGIAASGTIAAAAGATTFAGSSFLGSALGGVFVATTPVGWVVGSALILGAAGYGASKLVRSGSEQDRVRAELIQTLSERLRKIESADSLQDSNFEELNQLAAVCIAGGLIDDGNANRMAALVEDGRLDVEIAVRRLRDRALSAGLIEASS
jgi:hypothetical protein